MAADRGYAIAQQNLGCCFRDGDGVAQDDAEAVRFFELAAEQGLTDAECNLGLMYDLGRGVARDLAEATRWFERAAAKGHEQAKAALFRYNLYYYYKPYKDKIAHFVAIATLLSVVVTIVAIAARYILREWGGVL